MERIKLGKNGTEISKMGLGTWAIGGGPAWNGDLDKSVCVDTIHRAVELGINLIDTAPGYNFGKSEKIVGEALTMWTSICLTGSLWSHITRPLRRP